jgi:hypothetical protein
LPQQPAPFIEGSILVIENVFHSLLQDYSSPLNYGNNSPAHLLFRQDSFRQLNYLNTQFTLYVHFVNRHGIRREPVLLSAVGDHPVNYEFPQRDDFGRGDVSVGTERIEWIENLPCARISGSAASGKTSVCWYWVQCQVEHATVLWIHSRYRTTTSLDVVFLDGRSNVFRSFRNLPEVKLLALLDNNESFDIVVLDGAPSSSVMSSVVQHCTSYQAFLVVCVSGQSDIFPGTLRNHFYYGRDSSLVVNGFTLDEFRQADSLLSRVAHINERFFYGGGSARFLFSDKSHGMIALEILEIIDKIANFSGFFAGGFGDALLFEVNSLKTFYNEHSVIVSEYVTKILASKIDYNFIASAIAVNSSNPSWQGWVAKLECLNRIHYCAKNGVLFDVDELHADEATVVSSNWELFIPPGNIISYKETTELQPTLVANIKVSESFVYIPEKWNNWGFDAVIVSFNMEEDEVVVPHIRIIQCSIATDHSKLLEHAVSVLTALFPLTAADTYSNAGQQEFGSPYIQYVVLTRTRNLVRFNLNQHNPSGMEHITRWDNTIRRSEHSFKKHSFDGRNYHDYSTAGRKRAAT